MREWCYTCRKLVKVEHLKEVEVLLPAAKSTSVIRVCFECWLLQQRNDDALSVLEEEVKRREREVNKVPSDEPLRGEGDLSEVYSVITLDEPPEESGSA